MSIELVIPSNHLILCHPLLLLPSIFPSIRVFSNESAFHIKWPKYWSFSFQSLSHVRLFTTPWAAACQASLFPAVSQNLSSLSSSSPAFNLSQHQGLFSHLLSKRLSRVFSSTTVRKHQFFSAGPSLWSSSHICT